MRVRNFAPFLAVAALACGAESADQAAMADEPQEYAANADVASLEAFAADWETHYNMGHGSMVADYFAEDGLMWSGPGGMAFGREAIAAALQAGMDATSPQLSITQDDAIIVGNYAVARGTYTSEGTLDGETITNSGGWMSYAELIDGEWKLHGLVSSIGEGQSAPGFQVTEMPPAHESAAMVQEATDYFETHFNMGHVSMVAERYAEDVILVGSPENGRAALEANLQEIADAGGQVTVTPFASAELGDEYVTSIGTYSITTEEGTVTGHYSNLATRGEDGSMTTIWSLVSQHPTGM